MMEPGRCFPLRHAVPALALLPLLAAGALSPARADYRASYDVGLWGLSLAEAEFRLSHDAPRYTAIFSVTNAGVGNMISAVSGEEFDRDYRMAAYVDEDGQLLPLQYQEDNHKRELRYYYRSDGRLAQISVDPPEDRDRYELPRDAISASPPMHNTLSAIVALLREVEQSDSCAIRLPYFEGRNRFDIVSTDHGLDRDVTHLRDRLDGPPRRCELEQDVPDDDFGDDFEPSDLHNLTAWIGQIDGRAFPLRLEYPTDYGTAWARLSQLRLSSQDGSGP